jgi:hypothetical protein
VVVTYELSRSIHVEIAVFDVAGRRLKTLVNGLQQEGKLAVTWDRSREDGVTAPAGIYVIRLVTGDGLSSRKVIAR